MKTVCWARDCGSLGKEWDSLLGCHIVADYGHLSICKGYKKTLVSRWDKETMCGFGFLGDGWYSEFPSAWNPDTLFFLLPKPVMYVILLMC